MQAPEAQIPPLLTSSDIPRAWCLTSLELRFTFPSAKRRQQHNPFLHLETIKWANIWRNGNSVCYIPRTNQQMSASCPCKFCMNPKEMKAQQSSSSRVTQGFTVVFLALDFLWDHKHKLDYVSWIQELISSCSFFFLPLSCFIKTSLCQFLNPRGTEQVYLVKTCKPKHFW